MQTLSIISPPLALLLAIRRRPLRVTPIFRNVALSTFLGGGAIGAGLGWATMRGMGEEGISRKAISVRSDAVQRGRDDQAIIGGVLGGVSLPFFCACCSAFVLRR